MSGCGCGSGNTGQNRRSENNDPMDLYFTGTFAGGFRESFCKFKKTLTVSKLALPNILVFSENPCLAIGSELIFEDTSKADCVEGFAAGVYQVIANPVLVGMDWQVKVDAAWTSASNLTTFTFQTFASFDGCNTGSVDTSLVAQVCQGSENALNWSGYISTRPLNTPSSIVTITARSGSNEVTTAASNFSGKVGDYMQVNGSSLVDGNRAIITDIATGIKKPDGTKITKITFDRPVVGITQPVIAGTQDYCLEGKSRVRPIADFYFDAKACCVDAIIDAAVTSAENFPQGNRVDAGSCGGQEYCLTILDATPGAEYSQYQGTLLLT